MRKQIGKITSVKIGMGGYDDAMFGVSIGLGSDQGGWGCFDYRGTWASEPSESAKWTVADQVRIYGEAAAWVRDMLKVSGKKNIEELVGTPVEVTFGDDQRLASWRLLTEAL